MTNRENKSETNENINKDTKLEKDKNQFDYSTMAIKEQPELKSNSNLLNPQNSEHKNFKSNKKEPPSGNLFP